MKLLLALALAIPFAAEAQTDAMPPEQNAPAMHHDTKAPAVPSTTLTVTTNTGTVTLTLADLQALPQQTITVHNAHSKADETYTGPLVSDVLAKTGYILSDKTEHPMLHQYLVATGTDKYFVVYSVAEVQPGLNNTKVIVSLTKDGKPLTYSGKFQLANSSDAKPARWVHNLTTLTIRTAE